MFLFRFLGKLLSFIGSCLTFLRNLVLNLIFLVFLASVLLLIFSFNEIQENWGDSSSALPAEAVLQIRPAGMLVERVEMDNPFSVLANEIGDHPLQTSVHELIKAIDAAREDEHIRALVVETEDLQQAGLSKLAELRAAIFRFRASGKPVLAYGPYFTQSQYYLASAADEIHLGQDGFVLLPGLARYISFFKNALDKLGIDIHVFRVGEYKSFSEPFTRTDMSEEDRNSSHDLLNGLWQYLRHDLQESRQLDVAVLDNYINNYDKVLMAAGGDTAKAARDSKLVDHISSNDKWENRLKTRLGQDESTPLLPMIKPAKYLKTITCKPDKDNLIAVLVAQGAIVDGKGSADSVGGKDFAAKIRAVRENDAYHALVLRIDSPGGSAFASEQIRRELELTRDSGKPVVVSMSSVAASGGYWIAAGGNEIWAHPTTLTGSIGIFALVPNFSRPLEHLGITVDGVSTGPMAGALDPRRPLPPQLAQTMQIAIEHGYRRFIGTVSKARKMPNEEVDQLARGRVWLGEAASKIGLVDHLGDMDDAIAAAAKLAKLDHYTLFWPQNVRSPRVEILRLLSNFETWAGLKAEEPIANSSTAPLGLLLSNFQQEARQLLLWRDPQHLYAHCLCTAP